MAVDGMDQGEFNMSVDGMDQSKFKKPRRSMIHDACFKQGHTHQTLDTSFSKIAAMSRGTWEHEPFTDTCLSKSAWNRSQGSNEPSPWAHDEIQSLTRDQPDGFEGVAPTEDSDSETDPEMPALTPAREETPYILSQVRELEEPILSQVRELEEPGTQMQDPTSSDMPSMDAGA